MSMSTQSRREYLNSIKKRYQKTKLKDEKTKIINEVLELLGYHRKYAITVLNQLPVFLKPKRKRNKSLKYLEAMPVIEFVWEALNYPCAERLYLVLFETKELLVKDNEIGLNPTVSEQLQLISRATLARRLGKWCSPKRTLPQAKPAFKIKKQAIADIYRWDEQRSGALEVDLVEHNGGSALGHFACTLSVVDIVTGYSRRRAVLGKGQKVVFEEIEYILLDWPFAVWGFHSDSGGEFLNDRLCRFCKKSGLEFTRSRPYRKNDNAHVEQKNRQFVREIFGYERYDTPEELNWLNEVYASLDPYANLFLPIRKVVFKERQGAKVKKRYDIAKIPLQRLIEKDVLTDGIKNQLLEQYQSLNPLALHRRIESLLAAGPQGFTEEILYLKKSLLFLLRRVRFLYERAIPIWCQ